ncbi:hypothetical protein CAURIS_10455 [Corynebacterium auris]|uniref:Uncharacterized protein n=1 Tax=Corynebacterium timonense TaxID=441500 RepID=A0A1H1VAE3_9CORY|nr:hypothetical protein CAURIS_10455 [Corynebacterium auris]SDS81229.1 hypothetical protein SAMN04488539_2446 [Corynebacterium timonense]
MLSSAFDIAGDLINYLVWTFKALSSGNPLFNLGSSFPR